MNDEVFVYKCPSCSGKVNYNEGDHKWHCEYCGNSYDALFAIKEQKELPNMNDKKYLYYSHFCSNCHEKFLSKYKENAICPRCNTQSIGLGNETIVSKVLNLHFSQEQADYLYYNEIKKYNGRIDGRYFSEKFVLEYINCDLYNGCIKITDGIHTKKYVFMNLLIPNIEYEDFRFMYEVGNIGVRNSLAYSKDQNGSIESLIEENIRYFTNVEDIDYSENIVEACLNDFIKYYGVVNLSTVKINNNLSISDGVYIPIYRKTINNENQYVFGNVSSMRQCIVQYPEETNSRSKTKTYRVLTNISKISMVPCFIGSVFSFHFESSFMFLFILLFIIAAILYYTFNNKYMYYLNTIKISKDDYFEQIINNSNYVKGIKVGK